MDGEALGHVEPVLLVLLHLGQMLLALAHDHVTRRARAAAAAVVLEVDLVGERDVEHRARLAVVGERVLLVVDLDGLVERKKRHAVDRHYSDSMISAARFVPSAPLRAASIISSARCSVARFSAVVASRMASRSWVSRTRPSAARAVSIAARSDASTRCAPWRSARSTWVITVSASLRVSISIRVSTSASAYVKESSTIRSTSAS